MQNKVFVIIALAAGLTMTPVHAQLASTPHDLRIPSVPEDDNNEICVYCHTPHAARTDIVAPLWNKPATGATYSTYDVTTTMDGIVLAVGSVSIACLACHDGTQAMDTVINEPGSGLGDGSLSDLLGVIPPNSAANITPDLRDDHPIGVQYGGFDPGAGKIDPDFKGTGEGLSSDIGSLGLPRWWVDVSGVGTAGVRDKTDMILYTRDNGGNQPFVECASCHDPHEGGGDPNYMRIPNTNSNVCLACHVK